MPISKPLRMFAVRLSEEERARLEEIAAARKLTLSEVVREGLRLYAQEVGEALRQEGERVRAT